MTLPKISIIGAGNVGATTAHLLALKTNSQIVLVDINHQLAQAKSLDISQSLYWENRPNQIIHTNDYHPTQDSQIVIVTAGKPRQPGMDREELISANSTIIKSVANQIKKTSPNAIIIVVTNPLDPMTHLVLNTTKFKPSRVIGMAGTLDTARFAYFLSQASNTPITQIKATVLGAHGDSMVPLISHTTINNKPLEKVLTPKQIDTVIEKTQNGGKQIVQLLGNGSAYYAPASSITAIVNAILTDSKTTLPCCAYLSGEYQIKDQYLGVPVTIGKNGIEKIHQLKLTPAEQKQLKASAQKTRELTNSCLNFN